MMSFSFSEITRDLRCGPAITRSIASSTSSMLMSCRLRRADRRAASLMTLARSAPVKPGVRRATVSRLTSSARGLPRAWTFMMASRPLRSGRSTVTWRSKRPGRSRAGSRMSGRLVAADGVDLVDEDDGRGARLGLLEQVADPGGADADEHLDEVRTRDREEGHARLTGNRPGEQRLAGAGRAEQEHALGDLGAHLLELRRALEELL